MISEARILNALNNLIQQTKTESFSSVLEAVLCWMRDCGGSRDCRLLVLAIPSHCETLDKSILSASFIYTPRLDYVSFRFFNVLYHLSLKGHLR